MSIDIQNVLRTVFRAPRYRALFMLASVGVFALLYMIPVWTTPGNTIAFHASILPPWVFVVMIVLSLLNGLLITMQWHVRQAHQRNHVTQNSVKESATVLGILGSALASTMACAACYSSLLALFGLGATAFIVEYQAYIALFAITLTVVALYYTAKRVENKCAVCAV